jgi:hypothetical protein
VTPAHRTPRRVTRRRLLGLAGLAAVPAATLALQQTRGDRTGAEATTTTPSGRDVPVAATPSSAAVPPGPAGDGGPVRYVRGKTLLGAYLDLEGLSAQRAQDLRRSQLGRDQRIVHLFYDWTDALPRSVSYLPAKAVPMVSWRGCDYADILGGGRDPMIERAARNLRALGRPALLRWGWEMNGDWYDWGGAKNGRDTADYIKCWQRIHGIFAAQGADNVSWVWSVNWNSSPEAAWNQYQDYYPGDRYVDWVGVSGYNLHRESPDTLFAPVVAGYGAKKPIIISEVGAVDRGGRTKADWIALLAQWVEQHPAVGAVTWFDTDTHPGYEERWRIDTDAKALAAYRAMARDPHFSA